MELTKISLISYTSTDVGDINRYRKMRKRQYKSLYQNDSKVIQNGRRQIRKKF